MTVWRSKTIIISHFTDCLAKKGGSSETPRTPSRYGPAKWVVMGGAMWVWLWSLKQFSKVGAYVLWTIAKHFPDSLTISALAHTHSSGCHRLNQVHVCWCCMYIVSACQVLSNFQQISCMHRQDSMSPVLHACKVLSNVTKYRCCSR